MLDAASGFLAALFLFLQCSATLRIRGVLIFFVCTSAAPLLAGEPAREIEEIIVTAQKREANIQDVPISMTALGADDIEFRGIYDLSDLQRQVPNLIFGEREGTTTVSIRGVGLNIDAGLVEGG